MVLNICHGIKTAGTTWPNASNTGTTGVLTAVPGSATSGTGWSWHGSPDFYMDVTSAGVTVSNLDVDGPIIVTAANVTISNCRVECDNIVGIQNATGAANVTVSDCTVVGPGGATGGGMSGVRNDGGVSFQVLRCNISGVENGVFHGGTSGLIQDNYIHDLVSELDDVSAHTDGIQLVGANESDGTTVRHNAVYSVHTNATSAFIMGVSANVTVTNNKFRGGYGVMRIYRDTTCSYTNNRIGDQSEVGGSALATDDTGGTGDPTWTGNVNDDTEASIPKWW